MSICLSVRDVSVNTGETWSNLWDEGSWNHRALRYVWDDSPKGRHMIYVEMIMSLTIILILPAW